MTARTHNGLSFERIWHGSFEFRPPDDPRATGTEIFHTWCEDAKGRWIGDLHFAEISLDQPHGLGTGGPQVEKGDPTPGRLVLACYEGEETVKVPFTIDGIPMPAPPKD